MLNLNSVMVGLQYLFLEPNADDPLNKGALSLFFLLSLLSLLLATALCTPEESVLIFLVIFSLALLFTAYGIQRQQKISAGTATPSCATSRPRLRAGLSRTSRTTMSALGDEPPPSTLQCHPYPHLFHSRLSSLVSYGDFTSPLSILPRLTTFTSPGSLHPHVQTPVPHERLDIMLSADVSFSFSSPHHLTCLFSLHVPPTLHVLYIYPTHPPLALFLSYISCAESISGFYVCSCEFARLVCAGFGARARARATCK